MISLNNFDEFFLLDDKLNKLYTLKDRTKYTNNRDQKLVKYLKLEVPIWDLAKRSLDYCYTLFFPLM